MILPLPRAPFEWLETAAGPALVCLPLQPHAAHFFTTRRWSIGAAALDAPEEEAAWKEIAAALGVDAGCLVRARQIHGAAVLVAGDGKRSLKDADIVVSDDQRLAVAVQTADCVPLLIADRRTRACAAAHAGWRGLASRAPATAVDALTREFGSRPSDLVAAVGPSIGACCYEVGIEVRGRFETCGFADADLGRWFLASAKTTETNRSLDGLPPAARSGHWYFDPWQATRDQLEAVGVPNRQIYVAELCTASHAGVFCSYRRDGVGAGRLAAAIRSAPRCP